MIETIVPLATAISTIIAIVVPVLKSNSRILHEVKGVKLDTKRLILHDDQCSIEERINAGDEYMKLGGNGASRIYYEGLVAKYKKEICEE
jgi:hypothetical protein